MNLILILKGQKLKKVDPPVPDPSDYNKYETDIDSNEVTDPSQNKAVEGSNLKEKMKLKKAAKRKADATDKLITDTNRTLNSISGKKKGLNSLLEK